MKKYNPNIFYIIDIAGALILTLLMILNWNTTEDYLLAWEYGVGYSGYMLTPSYIIMGILFIILVVYQHFLMKKNKLTVDDLTIENFDEHDEREMVLKNKLYRRIMQANGYCLLILLSIIALSPPFQIKSYVIGIFVCIYIIVRDITLILHNTKVKNI